MEDRLDPGRCWRARTSSRVVAALVWLPLAAWASVEIVLKEQAPVYEGVTVVALACLAVWAFAFRPRLCVDGTAVEIQNPLRRHRLEAPEVTDIWVAYSGIRFERSSGPPVTAWAVQEWNLSKMLHRRTRAQEVAEALRQRLIES